MNITEEKFDEIYNIYLNKNENEKICMICHNDENLIKISCGHEFHEECLKKIYIQDKNKNNFNCPYCNSFIKLINCKYCKKKNIRNPCYACSKENNLNKEINSNNSENIQINTCQHIIKTGKNKGQICGRKLKDNKCRYHK